MRLSITLPLILSLALLQPGLAQAQNMGQDAQGAPAVPASHSVEQADARLVEVARERALVQEQYAASEQLCQEKFFVFHCLDQAKEKRRVALAALRAIEVEASHYKRQEAVELRDRELAERLRKDAEEQAQRASVPPKAAPVPDGQPRAAPSGPTLEQRQAEHDAKVRRQQAEEATGADKRAANVMAYEQKQHDSEQRQAAIAKKKEEAARKRAARIEAEKKKAEAAAASALKR